MVTQIVADYEATLTAKLSEANKIEFARMLDVLNETEKRSEF
ncbi:MarR family transcriptional regulator, partial [Lacticaseibacillus paracasei]